MNVEQRTKLERKVITHAINSLANAGWKLHSVYDGGEYVDAPTTELALDAVFAVEEATIRFTKEGVKGLKGIFVVLGNSGWDVISDYSTGDNFDTILDAEPDFDESDISDFLVVCGNPVNGFFYYGPFETQLKAIAWAEKDCRIDWWTAPLTSPTAER